MRHGVEDGVCSELAVQEEFPELCLEAEEFLLRLSLNDPADRTLRDVLAQAAEERLGEDYIPQVTGGKSRGIQPRSLPFT